MARVSRKSLIVDQEETAVVQEKVYHTAAYVRLSVEDNNRAGDRESIGMQQFMLERYIATQPDMQLERVFCDNGETGTNFSRPGFEDMMDEVRKRKIDCIVVKDLSRFGRNYVEAGYYLEKIFPFLGVRFVAVNDHYDTLNDNGQNELVLSLKNLVNDLYARDISKKISSALTIKRKNGEFIGAFPPYGYKKSEEDKHKLVIDEETAPVVRDIFRWRLQGQGLAQVARRLNEHKIPCPAVYQYRKGYKKKKPSGAGAIWQAQGIKVLTRNPVYAGHMAQGKRRESLSEGIAEEAVSPEDWIVVKHTHEAIVSQEVFDQVQEMVKKRHDEICALRGKYPSTENIFKGILICGDCGTKMVRYKEVSRLGTIRYGFHCRVYAENLSGQGCTRKWVGEPELKEAVLCGLKVQMDLATDRGKLLKKLRESPEYQSRYQAVLDKIRQVQQKIKRNQTIRSSLFASYAEKVLTEPEYRSMKKTYGEEADGLKKELLCLEEEEKKLSRSFSLQEEWITALKSYEGEKAVTKKMVSELIQCIKVSGYHEIEIIWNFQDEFERIAREIGNTEEGKENGKKESRKKENRKHTERPEKKEDDPTCGEVTE